MGGVFPRGHAEDDELVEREEEVEVRELLERDGDGGREAVWEEVEGRVGEGEVEVGGGVGVGVVGAGEGGEGLEAEEEEAVEPGDGGLLGHGGGGGGVN